MRGFSLRAGIADGLPIAAGYLAVSFGFGVMVTAAGLPLWFAVLVSAVNLTSAGQLAGLGIITAGGGYFELILTEFVINIRYALMSLTLSQKADETLTLPHRFAIAFGITDEVFGVAAAKTGLVGRRYLYGVIGTAYLGWVGGTLCGAVLGSILPVLLQTALGIALYAMFLAIILPPARAERGVAVTVAGAILLSAALFYFPAFAGIPSGFSVILAAVPVAAFAAWRYPISPEVRP